MVLPQPDTPWERHLFAAGNGQILIEGQGFVLFRVGDQHLFQVHRAVGEGLAAGYPAEYLVRGAGGHLQQGLRFDQGGGGLIHKPVDLVDGLDQLLEQQADGDDRPAVHPAGADQHHRHPQQGDLKDDFAQLFQTVKQAHVFVVLLLGVADVQDARFQTVLLVFLGVHAADQFQVGDGLADLAVQGCFLVDDLFPDAVLGPDLKGRNHHRQHQVQQHDAGHHHRRMEQHLGQGAHRRQDGGKHIVAEDLDQLAEARHTLVELGGFLTAEAAGIIGHRHLQQLFDAERPHLCLMGGHNAVQQHPPDNGDPLGSQVDQAEQGNGCRPPARVPMAPSEMPLYSSPSCTGHREASSEPTKASPMTPVHFSLVFLLMTERYFSTIPSSLGTHRMVPPFSSFLL